MNKLIEQIFNNFKIDNKKIPVEYLKYDGKETTYITYTHINNDDVLNGDNEVIGYFMYYDFDIFSKGNYSKIIKEVKKILKENGFIWCPSMSSGDIYEYDTEYYHRTLCFKIEKMED